MNQLSPFARYSVLTAAILGLVFDGFELGLMPVASISVSKSLLGEIYTKEAGGEWFAKFTASLMTGAAIGGILLGRLGDRIGRSKAMGISILFYSVFAGMGGFVSTQEQMFYLRFLVGLGVGGVWPNAVALCQECWPDKSKPWVAGLLGAALNCGILLLSQLARMYPITSDSWRWLFQLAAFPIVLGILVLILLPESPLWLNRFHLQQQKKQSETSGEHQHKQHKFLDLFKYPLLSSTIAGMLLGTIPLVGAWAASKWMIPWSDEVSRLIDPGYKGTVQGYWALGAVLGSFSGAHISAMLGRKLSYFLISIGATVLTMTMFLGSAPLNPEFVYIVFLQAFISTLFFGWLPLYLPQLFPVEHRASGTGVSYNIGRFVTAIGIFAASGLFQIFDGSYSKVGAVCSLVYGVGMVVIFIIPENYDKNRTLESK